MKKGFTLIELMAVIILIGIIGLISIPAINKTLAKQKMRNFTTNIKGLISSVKIDAEEDKFKFPRTYTYVDEELSLVEVRSVTTNKDLQISGKIIGGSGTIKYNNNGEMYVLIRTNDFCGLKYYNEELVVGKMQNNKCYDGNTQLDLTIETSE